MLVDRESRRLFRLKYEERTRQRDFLHAESGRIERITYDLNSDHMESFPIEPDHGDTNKGGLAGNVALGSQSVLSESV